MNTRKTVYCRAGTEEVTYANHSRRKEQGVENTGAEHEEISGKTDVGLHSAPARLRLSGAALHAELPVLGWVRDLHIACGAEGGETTITEESMKKSAARQIWACTIHLRDCDYHVLHPEQNCRYSGGRGICTSRAAQKAATNKRSKG
jgi:hypothetical protein